MPTREANGEIRIAAPASPALVAAYNEGRKFLSIEFHSLKETRSAAGVREIQSAFLPGAALVAEPEYKQANRRSPGAPAAGLAVTWPWRQDGSAGTKSYTDLAISRIMVAAASWRGSDGSSARRQPRQAARLWAAGLSSATIIARQQAALKAVTPTFLDAVRR